MHQTLDLIAKQTNKKTLSNQVYQYSHILNEDKICRFKKNSCDFIHKAVEYCSKA